MWSLGVLILLLGVGALRVSQDPGEARVTAGDKVALVCQVLVAEPWDLLRLEWVKDPGHRVLCDTRLHPTALPSPSPCTPRLHLAWDPPWANLSLRQARGDDAGWYLCRVTIEIPCHSTATGNGTLLSVSTADGGHQWCRGGGPSWVPPSAHPPKKLLPPPTVMENSTYEEGLQRARDPPAAPRP
ncbi:PREDICTED: transmembrane and immunoglobulin domain-containing protein 2 [Calidris pugnax]|uniref:transmembrane and immunoglobulin domain-containing protein 2 n=1 Tax=Calidris pugnax TaxID=198806 RepID=UPI00071D9DD4|nr:PREDICTED: transmembrane and immunoglobulin domain-containing protein 2 [Calidris pugnax]